jgi:hypothetical protein
VASGILSVSSRKEIMCNYALKCAHKHLNHLGEAVYALSDNELSLPVLPKSRLLTLTMQPM